MLMLGQSAGTPFDKDTYIWTNFPNKTRSFRMYVEYIIGNLRLSLYP